VPQAPLLANGEIDCQKVMEYHNTPQAVDKPQAKCRSDGEIDGAQRSGQPQIVTPMEKSDADGPVTIKANKALPGRRTRREAPLSQQLTEANAAEQQRQQAIMLHYYQQQQKLAEARREQRQAEYDSSLTRWQPNTAMPNRRRTTMRLRCSAATLA
jgi:hypothetical protein